MQPILIILFATAAGVPLGLWLRHNLATLSYRTEDEQDLPDPGPRWWVVWTCVLAVGGLATAASLSHDPLVYLPLVPLAITGPWIAAVDFDVLRIPNRVLAPIAVTTLVAVVCLAAVTEDWPPLVVDGMAALLAGGVFAAAHCATKGGVGFGDVKFAAAIGLALGPLGLGAVCLSMFVGLAAALVWAVATRRSNPIPLGPWLLLGSWTSALMTAAATGHVS